MTLKVLYFAVLREEKGCVSEMRQVPSPMTMEALFLTLFERSPIGIRFALNQRYVSSDTLLSDGDEVAFLPPLGGG